MNTPLTPPEPGVTALPGWRSLRAKLVAVVLLTTVTTLAVALAAMALHDQRRHRQDWAADMRMQAELLVRSTATALAAADSQGARDNLAVLRLRPPVQAAAVYDARQRLFATYAVSQDEGRFPTTVGAEGAVFAGPDVVVFQRVPDKGELLGTVYLRARHEGPERLAEYGGMALAVAAVAALMAFVLSARLQRHLTRPVTALSALAREVAAQPEAVRRAPRQSDDEVGELADAFNGMLTVMQQRHAQGQQALQEAESEVQDSRAAQQDVLRLNADLERRLGECTAQLDQVRRELALATDNADRAVRAKSEFIASMSQELRTPLNDILGFGQLLVSASQTYAPDKQREFMQHILKAGHDLLILINEILGLARIESASTSLALEPVDLDAVLHECRIRVEPAAQQRAIQIKFPESAGLSVVADRARLRQVLLNLLSNAVKYNREQGSVVVSYQETPHGRVRVTVQDTGPGLAPEQLASVFKPFNRLDNRPEQELASLEGSGISLVVTKRLVELMGGDIGVTSTPGAGSEFWVEFKSNAAPTSAPVPPAEEAAPATEDTRHVLLYVEDNLLNRVLVEEILAARGDVRLLTAPDARQGLELARQHRPDVILMDVNLPGLSGRDALAVLRADSTTSAIPVIAVTANAMAHERSQGLSAGFFRYVTKPIDIHRLYEAIDEALAFVRG